jgi:hypothetical protein
MFTFISSDLILKSTMSITSKLIYNIDYIRNFKFQDKELEIIFVDRDILSDIGIIKTYIQEHHSKSQFSPSFKTAVQNLNETLEYLEIEINSLASKIKNHNLKWFASYRSYGIEKEKQKIITLIQQMNHRFEMLLKIM